MGIPLFVRKYPLAVAATLFCALCGLLILTALPYLSSLHLPGRELPREPEPTTPTDERSAGVAVIASYPGMPAPAVEKALTNRIERWVGQADGVLRTESRSVAGVSVVRVTFRAGIPPAEAVLATNSLVLAALPSMPPGTLPPLVLSWDPARVFPLGQVAVESETLDEAQLTEVARVQVRSALETVPGVLVPWTLGGKERAVVVRLDPARLEARGLTVADVARALRERHLSVVPGPPSPEGTTVLLDRADVPNLDAIDLLPLRERPGPAVFLRDVGTIQEGTLPAGMHVRLDGRRGVCVLVYRQGEDGPTAVRERVVGALGELRKKVPADARFTFHPQAGAVMVLVRAPAGTSLDAAEKRIAEVERAVAGVIPAAQRAALTSVLGAGPDWGSAVATANAGPQDATLWVALAEGHEGKAPDLVRRLRHRLSRGEDFKDLQFAFAEGDPAAGPQVDGVPCALAVRVTAPSLDQGLEAARAVRERVAPVRGAADVQVVERLDAPYLEVEADRRKAAAVGLSAAEVLRQAAAALEGGANLGAPPWIEEAGRTHTLAVPLAVVRGAPLEGVLQTAATGVQPPQAVPLRDLVRVRRTTAAVEIHHANGARVFTVRVNTENRDRAGVLADVEWALQGLRPAPGVQVEIEARQGL